MATKPNYLSLRLQKYTVHESGPFHADDATRLGVLLQMANSLKTLRISFNELGDQKPPLAIHLLRYLSPTCHWPHLTSLSLEAIATTAEDLKAFLLRHARSLRSLELSDIVLLPTTQDNLPQECWIDIIHFLATSLALTYVEFNNSLVDVGGRTWHSRGERGIGNVSCLRSRVERFVTRKGVSPFNKVSRAVIPGERGFYWTVDQIESDESWTVTPPSI
jgi:hypothetical protein